MKLHIHPSPAEVLTALADYFVTTANEAFATSGRFTVALSGGSSPKALYELLASDAYSSKVDWQKIAFFLGDERFVPLTDADSNYLMAKQTLFDPLDIPAENIFPVNTAVEPNVAASEYDKTIKEYFKESTPVFDLVLLGLGDNSHTASLFPHTTVLNDTLPAVKEVWLHEQKVYRITLNAPLINAASNIVFLVYGAGKAEAVHHVLEDEMNIQEYPAQLIRRDDGVHWFLEEGAAQRIQAN